MTIEGLLTCTTSMLSTLDIDDREGLSNSSGFSCRCWICSLVEVFSSSFRLLRLCCWLERCCSCCCCSCLSGMSSPFVSPAFMFQSNFLRRKHDPRVSAASRELAVTLHPLCAAASRAAAADRVLRRLRDADDETQPVA